MVISSSSSVSMYRFNARDIDGVLTVLTDDVAWANGMDGGYVHGREAVRAYWTRQWTIDQSACRACGLSSNCGGCDPRRSPAVASAISKANRSKGRRTGLKTRRSDTFSVFERARWLASKSRMLHRARRRALRLRGSWRPRFAGS